MVSVRDRGDIAVWREGAAWLAGGTFLFSEPQPRVDRLIDLAGFGWPPLTATDSGLQIASTCTLAQLHAWAAPPEWIASSLIDSCCR